jgi:hypothetical protein
MNLTNVRGIWLNTYVAVATNDKTIRKEVVRCPRLLPLLLLALVLN